KSRILTYNEDDCIATMHIKDWLAAQSETASK
ncbi:MAG: ribonuclease H-like domain-containing protein, partial [Chloroflexi bacterium]|nr:ribonuclease H-like domain-containing protein [Chloroflexota bacterium]